MHVGFYPVSMRGRDNLGELDVYGILKRKLSERRGV